MRPREFLSRRQVRRNLTDAALLAFVPRRLDPKPREGLRVGFGPLVFDPADDTSAADQEGTSA